MRYVLLTAAMIFLTSCQNPYAQFYQGLPDARVTPYYEPSQEDLHIYASDNIDRDARALIRRGFFPIGNSTFNADPNAVSERQLRRQAAKIGAHAVLVASRYTHTISGAVPLTIPQTTTSYSTANVTAHGSGGTVNAYGNGTTTTYGSQTVMMPYSIARSDFGALYFVRAKSRLGIWPIPVDDETRRHTKTNAGVIALVVIEGTPAFAADVLPGDVVLSIGDDSVQSVDQFYKLIEKYQGQRPDYKIFRDGEIIRKQIEIKGYESHPIK